MVRGWPQNPLLRPTSLLLVALAMSIGWGIRGNYGHETGAMFPGALAAIAACLASGREDWHRRVIFFALFGMLGWAFGGSISYMMVIGYTHSGHESTQWFGFMMLFVIGFLWAGLGGAGACLPAVFTNRQLIRLMRPLTILVLMWTALFFWGEHLQRWFQRWFEQGGLPPPSQRQELALYWFDSDWFEVTCVLMVLLLYDLVRRRFQGIVKLIAFAAVGGVSCFLLFYVVDLTVGNERLGAWLVQPQGQFEDRFSVEDLAVTNWPQAILHLGRRDTLLYPGETLALWGGALLGVMAFYIWRRRRFADGAGLFVSMAMGWLIAFLTLPVLGSLGLGAYGGLRMTPPRGDSWAGVVGTLLAALIYCWRRGYRAIVIGALTCGLIGGIGFSGAAWLEATLVSWGNPNLQADPEDWRTWQQTVWEPNQWGSDERMPPPEFARALEASEGWQRWRQQNWHSSLEQTYGFVNGLGVACALALLATRTARRRHSPTMPVWQVAFALVMVLPVLAFVNLVKNVEPWTTDRDGYRAVPESLPIPWTSWSFSTENWCLVFAVAATVALLAVFWWHSRRPIALFEGSWSGRGQLLFLVILTVFVAGNFARQLPEFSPTRMVTEGVIQFNALVVAVLVLGVPRIAKLSDTQPERRWRRQLIIASAGILLVAALLPLGEVWGVRRMYGDAPTGLRGMNYRFGPNANWKREPLLKQTPHR